MRQLGNLYLIMIGLLLCLAGAVFAWLMWRSFDRAAGQRGWQDAPCRILESEVMARKIGEDVPSEYGLKVLFGYEFGGESRTSDLLSIRGVSWSRDQSRAQDRAERYRVGNESVCHVDPGDPDRAVLMLDSKAPGYSLWFPLLIVAGGLGIIAGAVRMILRGRRGDEGVSSA